MTICAVETIPEKEKGLGVYSIFFTVPKRNGDWGDHSRLKVSELVHTGSPFQNGNAEIHFEGTAARQLSNIHKPHRSIPSYPHHSVTQVLCGRPSSAVPDPSIWAIIGSQSFLKNVINPIVHLREKEIHIFPYLGDLLIWSPSEQRSKKDTADVIQCLQDHGFIVKLAKSSLTPSQRMERLGVIVDTSAFRLFLPEKKVQKTMKMAELIIKA